MAAEKFIFQNFANITKTDCFLQLNEEELQPLIEAVIGAEQCSTNDIIESLYRWVVTTPVQCNTQSNNGRIDTFLTLVKKMPRNEFDEKLFAEIFLDDHRLRDNAMCRSFRDEYLCDLFKVAKRKTEDVEVEQVRKIVILEEPLASIDTSGNATGGTKSNMMTVRTERIVEKPTSTTSVQQSPGPSPSSSVQQAAVPDEMPQSRGSVRSKRIISGSDGSDCIRYFTSKQNGSWFIGSFNLTTGDVEKITNLPGYREDGALLHAYGYLYFIGGRILQDFASDSEYSDGQEVRGQVSRRVDIFDMTDRKWMTENLPQLKEAREDFQRCVCERYYIDDIYQEGCIHIVGGNRTDGSEIESVEFIQLYGITKQKPHLQATNLKLSPQQVKQEFSIQQAKEKVPQLQTRKMIPQLQTTKVIPQQEENSDNDSTEDEGGYKIYSLQGDIYDTASDKWIEIPKIPGARRGHSTAVYKSKFYVFGGVRKGAYSYKLSSAYVYDPDTNAWTMLPNMHRKRYAAAAVRHNNFIYIIGGDGDGCGNRRLTIEKFNPATNDYELIEKWLDKVPTDVNFYLTAGHVE